MNEGGGGEEREQEFELYHSYESARTRKRFVLKIKKVEKNELPKTSVVCQAEERVFRWKKAVFKVKSLHFFTKGDCIQ